MYGTLTFDASIADEVGQDADCSVDTSRELSGALVLDGFKVSTQSTIALAAAATDQALSFTNAAGLVLLSDDEKFSLRLAAGETLLTNLRAFVIWADASTNGAKGTSVLLTGNGTNEAIIRTMIIEKV